MFKFTNLFICILRRVKIMNWGVFIKIFKMPLIIGGSIIRNPCIADGEFMKAKHIQHTEIYIKINWDIILLYFICFFQFSTTHPTWAMAAPYKFGRWLMHAAINNPPLLPPWIIRRFFCVYLFWIRYSAA